MESRDKALLLKYHAYLDWDSIYNVRVFWVYSSLFQALSLTLLHSTSMACTVSSTSSRVSGTTVWDRTGVVPGAKRYWLDLGRSRDDPSKGAHQVSRPL